MLIESTLDRLHELGLTGMAQAFAEQLGVPDMQSISFEDRLALLLERETSERENRRPGSDSTRSSSSPEPPIR